VILLRVVLLLILMTHPVLAWDYQITMTDTEPRPTVMALANNPGQLQNSRVSEGNKNIGKVWLSDATARYQHGVFGQTVEAASITAELVNGKTVKYVLPENSVFEDRRLRLVDLNGDGKDEIITVRTYLDKGAATVVLAQTGEKLSIIAEAPAIGQSQRWLNPVGTADFDGDGRLEIAVVITPHIGGTLALYEIKAGKLSEKYSLYGFSNHANKTLEQRLSAIMDIDGDGRPEILLPNAGRTSLEIVSVKNGALKTLGSIPVGDEITGPFTVQGNILSAPLMNGQTATLKFTRH